MRPSFVSVLWCENENQAEGLGLVGQTSKPGSPLVYKTRRWCWPELISSEALELGQGMQCRQQLGAGEWLKDMLGVKNYCKGTESRSEANYKAEHHPV